MRLLSFHIIIFCFISTKVIVAQNTSDTNEIKNYVEKALQLSNEGKREESIKESFRILSLGVELSLNDSINLSISLADNLMHFGDYDNAITYAKKTIHLRSKLNKKGKIDYLYMMRFFNATKQYDSTIYYMKCGVNEILSLPEHDKYLLISTYNNIGFTYYLNDQLDSAKVYYKKVINLENAKEISPLIYGMATGNLGLVYYDNKKYKRALEKIKIDAKLTKGKIWQSYNNALFLMAKCHYELKNYNLSKEILVKLFGEQKQDKTQLLKAYRFMSKVSDKLNDDRTSSRYLNKYIKLNDSLLKNKKPNEELVRQLSKTKVNLIKRDLKLANNEVELINKNLLFRYKSGIGLI